MAVLPIYGEESATGLRDIGHLYNVSPAVSRRRGGGYMVRRDKGEGRLWSLSADGAARRGEVPWR